MTLQRLNAFLTKGMVGTFISIIPLSILTVIFPIVSYVVGGSLYLLMILTAANFVTATILLAIDLNVMMDAFIKQYEAEQRKEV